MSATPNIWTLAFVAAASGIMVGTVTGTFILAPNPLPAVANFALDVFTPVSQLLPTEVVAACVHPFTWPPEVHTPHCL